MVHQNSREPTVIRIRKADSRPCHQNPQSGFPTLPFSLFLNNRPYISFFAVILFILFLVFSENKIPVTYRFRVHQNKRKTNIYELYRMYTQFIFILVAIFILTLLILSTMKYKEGQCVLPNTPEAEKVQIRTNTINQRISDQTLQMASISSRINQILLNYSNFRFSVNGAQVDKDQTSPYFEIDQSSSATVSNPTFTFTFTESPKGEKGDMGNQGLPGTRGNGGNSGANGLPGYWGKRGGCYTK